MKKIIVVLVVAVMAFCAKAAAVDWSTGVFSTSSGADSSTVGKSSTAYEAIFYVYSDADGKNLIGSDSSTSLKKSGVMTGSLEMDAPSAGVTATYYTKLVIKENATGMELASTVGSFSWTGGDLADPSLEFYGEGAGGFVTLPSASSAGWQTVPEPTSALLLLVGAGLVGLRRKRV